MLKKAILVLTIPIILLFGFLFIYYQLNDWHISKSRQIAYFNTYKKQLNQTVKKLEGFNKLIFCERERSDSYKMYCIHPINFKVDECIRKIYGGAENKISFYLTDLRNFTFVYSAKKIDEKFIKTVFLDPNADVTLLNEHWYVHFEPESRGYAPRRR